MASRGRRELGRLVERRPALRADGVVSPMEPGDIDRPFAQILGGQRGPLAHQRLPRLVDLLPRIARVGQEPPDAFRKALPAERVLDEFHPLRRLEAELNEALLGHLRGTHFLGEGVRRVGFDWITDRDQVGQDARFADVLAVGIAAVE